LICRKEDKDDNVLKIKMMSLDDDNNEKDKLVIIRTYF